MSALEPSIAYVRELESAARAIVASRDMCGNERQALADWQDENRKLAAHEITLVLEHANRIWRMSQIAAGVPEKFHRF